MFTKKTVEDVDLEAKTVIVRVDYNVPIKDGVITDNFRIKQSIKTIEYLIAKQAKIVLIAHLGRPDGEVVAKYSLKPIRQELAKLIKTKVYFTDDCIGAERDEAVKKLLPGEILLCENLRFHKEEEMNDANFAQSLSRNGDIFVQEGFGVVHRAHASTEAITHYLPSVAGFLLQNEVDTITNVMNKPQKPLMAIIGGAKIADKIDLIKKFIDIADIVAVGGAMANTFLLAKNFFIGASLADQHEIPLARDILQLADQQAAKKKFSFILPTDAVVSTKIDSFASTRIVDWGGQVSAEIEHYPKKIPVDINKIKKQEMILDIGPFSASFIAGSMQLANTVIWNGTMGVTEVSSVRGLIGPYAHGTELIIEALLGEFGNKPYSLIGGGDTAGYIENRGLVDKFNHVSTGGGASLELMAGRKLPGVEALINK